MYVVVFLCGFLVDFKSYIMRFNYQDVQEGYGVIRFFFISEVDGAFNIV